MREKKLRGGSIGIFDSGVGGLSALKGIRSYLPYYDYVYMGDTLHAPYGSRLPREIYEFASQGADFLFSCGCEIVIMACHTASGTALRRMQKDLFLKERKTPSKRILGVLIPVAEEVLRLTENERIGLMATEATVRSGAFEREIKKLLPSAEVFPEACPLLVPLVEKGEQDSFQAQEALAEYLGFFEDKNIDTLILGCTHYGVFAPKIREFFSGKVNVVFEERVMGKSLEDYLQRHPEIEKRLSKNRSAAFYCTGDPESFAFAAERFYGENVSPIPLS